MNRSLPILLCSTLALSACTDIGGDVFDPGPDAAPPEPRTSLSFAGTYHSAQHWDMSSAFTDDEGLGGVIADMVVNAAVDLAGVPSGLQGEARDTVGDAVRAPIRDLVNSKVPADIVPDSALLNQLADIFSDVEVDTAIGLAPQSTDVNRLTGSEKVEAIRITLDTTSYDVPLADLLEGTSSSSAEADFTGSVTGQTSLSIGDHTLALRAGTLVSIAGVELLSRDDLETLTQQAMNAIVCADLVDVLVDGASSYGISVGGQSFSVSADDLNGGCADIKVELGDYVVGYFDRDSPVSLGGGVTMSDTDGDEAVDSLAGTASYDGELEVVSGILIRDFAVALDAQHE